MGCWVLGVSGMLGMCVSGVTMVGSMVVGVGVEGGVVGMSTLLRVLCVRVVDLLMGGMVVFETELLLLGVVLRFGSGIKIPNPISFFCPTKPRIHGSYGRQ